MSGGILNGLTQDDINQLSKQTVSELKSMPDLMTDAPSQESNKKLSDQARAEVLNLHNVNQLKQQSLGSGEKTEAAERGWTEGGSFGHGDEAVAAMMHPLGALKQAGNYYGITNIKDKDVDKYLKERDLSNKLREQSQIDNPATYGISKFGGSIASLVPATSLAGAAGLGMGTAAEGAGLGARALNYGANIAKGATTFGGIGAVQGQGESKAPTFNESLPEIKSDALTGGVIGGATVGAAPLVKSLIPGMTQTVNEAGENVPGFSNWLARGTNKAYSAATGGDEALLNNPAKRSALRAFDQSKAADELTEQINKAKTGFGKELSNQFEGSENEANKAFAKQSEEDQLNGLMKVNDKINAAQSKLNKFQGNYGANAQKAVEISKRALNGLTPETENASSFEKMSRARKDLKDLARFDKRNPSNPKDTKFIRDLYGDINDVLQNPSEVGSSVAAPRVAADALYTESKLKADPFFSKFLDKNNVADPKKVYNMIGSKNAAEYGLDKQYQGLNDFLQSKGVKSDAVDQMMSSLKEKQGLASGVRDLNSGGKIFGIPFSDPKTYMKILDNITSVGGPRTKAAANAVSAWAKTHPNSSVQDMINVAKQYGLPDDYTQ